MTAAPPRIGITTSPNDVNGRPHETLNRAYVQAVVAAGGLPFLLPVLEPSLAESTLDGLDGLVMSGGGDIDPARYDEPADPTVYGVHAGRDEWEFGLAVAAQARRIPVLAICRGTQVVNVAAGGSLIQDLASVTVSVHRDTERFADDVHRVHLDPSSLLATVLRAAEFGVNTLHHQAVSALGEGLRTVGWADDGTVEAIERIDGSALLGVQWHPELLVDSVPLHRRLFEWVVGEARDYRRAERAAGVRRSDLHVA